MKKEFEKQRGRRLKKGRSLPLLLVDWLRLLRPGERFEAAGRRVRILGVQQVPMGRMVTMEIKGGL